MHFDSIHPVQTLKTYISSIRFSHSPYWARKRTTNRAPNGGFSAETSCTDDAIRDRFCALLLSLSGVAILASLTKPVRPCLRMSVTVERELPTLPASICSTILMRNATKALQALSASARGASATSWRAMSCVHRIEHRTSDILTTSNRSAQQRYSERPRNRLYSE